MQVLPLDFRVAERYSRRCGPGMGVRGGRSPSGAGQGAGDWPARELAAAAVSRRDRRPRRHAHRGDHDLVFLHVPPGRAVGTKGARPLEHHLGRLLRRRRNVRGARGARARLLPLPIIAFVHRRHAQLVRSGGGAPKVTRYGGFSDGGGNSTGLVARGCSRFRSSCSLMAPVCRVARRAASAKGEGRRAPLPSRRAVIRAPPTAPAAGGSGGSSSRRSSRTAPAPCAWRASPAARAAGCRCPG